MKTGNEDPNDSMSSEKEHLKTTLSMIQGAISDADNLTNRTEDSYQSVKTYMVDNRGELDPSEQFQNELYLQRVDQQSAQALHAMTRLRKLLDSPYFAKIVFSPSDDEETIEAYIGRFSFSHDLHTIISDWRSPIAGLFYDYDVGPAQYETLSGISTGELELKRQFKIENGAIVYALDSASGIRDEILQQELSKTSDQKMKSIINSIQREQNKIIRDENTGTLIIQGVAGSGKTSIALHRVAYLLYRHKDTLNSNSVAILSPNKVFSDYISNVLPELGEEPIRELCLQDIYNHLIDDKLTIESARSFSDNSDEAWRARVKYKGSFEFISELTSYIEDSSKSIFKAQALTFGRCTLDAEWTHERFYKYPNLPINERIDLLISDIILELSSKLFSVGTQGIPQRSKIRAELTKMLEAKEPLALYRKFFKDTGKPHLFRPPAKQTIEWEDAAPLLIIQNAYRTIDDYRSIEQVVIDEMQDLTPVQHYMINTLFSCDKTILGDYHQMIDPENPMNLESLPEIYLEARVVELTKSYRSTLEITELAKKVKQIPRLESVERHGDQPKMIRCGNTVGVLDQIEKQLEEFHQSSFKTLGIVHKSESLAERYFELLSADHEVHYISPESTTFVEGVSVTSTKMAKGLEFDQVIILDADKSQYATADDRNFLYVAITRAMHKLSILYRAELTSFLAA